MILRCDEIPRAKETVADLCGCYGRKLEFSATKQSQSLRTPQKHLVQKYLLLSRALRIICKHICDLIQELVFWSKQDVPHKFQQVQFFTEEIVVKDKKGLQIRDLIFLKESFQLFDEKSPLLDLILQNILFL